MPLVKLQVRNEYGLGRPELYKEINREDPKAVLDGVAVAGLVGILRQLGDLADFAAEVFHGLQEQVLNTASRSHKLMLRAKSIEASLLPLEKAILAQNSHIHFAYTARCEWHCRTTTAQNHFIYNDLPQFILDSYEECQDPPHLHLLDKFDAGGPGSCLRRYSDPTFFKRVSSYSDEAYTEKIEKARKSSRSKKKRSSKRNGEILQGEQMPSNSGRMQFTSRVNEQTSSSQTASAIDTTLKSDPEDHSNSFDSSIDAGYIECVFYSSNSVQPDEQEHKESASPRLPQKTFTLQLASPAVGDNFSHDSFDKHIASTSTGLSWDKQEEIVDFKSLPCDRDETPEILAEKQNPNIHEDEAGTSASIDAGYIECVFYSSNSVQPDEQEHKESASPRLPQKTFTLQLASPAVGDNFSHDSFDKHIASTSTGLSWDKQEEIVDFKSLPCDRDETPEILAEKQNPNIHEDEAGTSANIDCSDFLYGQESNMGPVFCWLQTNKIQHESDNCLVALNSIESESGNDLDCETKREVEHSTSHVTCEIKENGVDGAASTVLDHGLCDGISQTIFCVSKNNETGWDFPDSPREVVPLISEPYVTSLESSFPSDVPVNIERTKILADSHDSGSPIQEQVMHIRGNSVLDFLAGTNFLDNAHPFNDTVSASIETALTDVPVDVERTNHTADSLASESPSHKETPTKCEISVLDCCVGTNPWGIHTHDGMMSESDVTGPSYIPVNIGRADHFTDSCASESPICKEVSHNIGNSASDCSVSTNLFGDAQTLDDTVSAFIETVSSDVPVDMGRTKNLADSDGSESLMYEKLPHMCGNSDLDYSIGTSALGDPHTLSDAVSASTETGPSEVSVDIGRADVFTDSHASESPICEQVPLKCGVPVSDCSVGTDTLGDVQTYSETVSAVSIDTLSSDVPLDVGRTKNLVESDASEIRICEQVPQTYGNSVLDYSIGTNSSGDAHTLNNAVSASIETVLPDVPTNLELTKNLANSPVSESSIHEQMPHICGNSVLNCSIGTNSLGNTHTLVLASIESGSKSSDLPKKEADRINSNTYKCEETHPESATDPSVGLWTNGGLLGLEPSKPPDFISPSSLNHESLTSLNETDGALNQNSMLKSNGHKEKQDLLAEIAELNKNEPSPRCLISQYDDQTCIPGKTFDCHQLSSGFGQNDKEDLDEVRVLAPGSVVPASQNTKTACTEHNKGSGENSPLLFGLTHKLLINSFRRRVSFDEKSGPGYSLKTGLLEQSGQNSTVHQSLPETTIKEKVSRESPIYSPPPSPQLEHMKISFHPVNELETFKLKLKFPEGSKHRESIRDMFPSFHLVPEPSTPLHDSGSNSDDDDTFGRSSPFVSDDCLSPQSAYNSDRWESDDTPNSSDHEVYDSSLGISFTQSNLSSQEIRGGTNVDIDNGLSMYSKDTVESSLHGPLLDFPSFDTVKPVLVKECNEHSDYSNTLKLQSHSQPTQPEPPHPPNQKWVSNLQLDMMNESKTYISEDAEKIYDPNISEPTVQPRLAQLEQNKTDQEDHEFYDDSSCKLKDELNQRDINGQNRDDQVGIGKDMDEKKDFLHQIRTKSFNLKRTVTGKPNATTSPTINVKVTAILEKTNAIRQVVASDDGEDDDSWSDT